MIRYRQSPSSATFSTLNRMERRTLQIRWRYARSGFRLTVGDVLFNLAHAAAVYTLPQRLKLAIVDRLRNEAV